jgi:hypothetical protein
MKHVLMLMLELLRDSEIRHSQLEIVDAKIDPEIHIVSNIDLHCIYIDQTGTLRSTKVRRNNRSLNDCTSENYSDDWRSLVERSMCLEFYRSAFNAYQLTELSLKLSQLLAIWLVLTCD